MMNTKDLQISKQQKNLMYNHVNVQVFENKLN